MIHDSGITSFVKNSESAPSSIPGVPNMTFYYDTVKDVILTSSDPLFNDAGGYAGIGSVILESGNIVRPLNPHAKNLPLPEETVLIFNLDINYQLINNNSTITYQPRLFYLSIIDFTSHPQYNASFGKYTDNKNTISKVFNNVMVNPLQPYLGDNILEGRFGNSIRFSSTNTLNSQNKQGWSSDSEIGSPITIIRNGPSPLSNKTKFIPIIEDINHDLSSIYATSTQLIPIELPNENYFSYPEPPISPSRFNKPQIIFNSDRIVIGAKKDHILLSAQKSINLASNESINIDSKNTIIDSKSIKLGGKNAKESILLGDKTVVLLEQILISLSNLMSILENEQIYPNGVAAPNTPLNLVASNTKEILNNIKDQLNNIKSQTSKTT
jgi:hypothetical protein